MLILSMMKGNEIIEMTKYLNTRRLYWTVASHGDEAVLVIQEKPQLC
jgi:hypothetical protein